MAAKMLSEASGDPRERHACDWCILIKNSSMETRDLKWQDLWDTSADSMGIRVRFQDRLDKLFLMMSNGTPDPDLYPEMVLAHRSDPEPACHPKSG